LNTFPRLNARKAIRQRQVEARGQMYELETLRNSTFNRTASVHPDEN
jgi:hypothetical protein